MTDIIAALEELVMDGCRAAFPEAAAPCIFTPIADSALGDLGTDLPQRVASQLRLPPAAVSEKLLQHFETSALGTFRAVDDFLNITLSDETLLSAQISAKLPAAAVILVLPRRRDLDPLGYARVVCSASMQWLLGGRRGALVSAFGTAGPLAPWPQFKDWLFRTLCAEPEHGERSTEDLSKLIAQISGPGATLWLYPDFLGRQRFRELTKTVRERTGGDFSVQCLDRSLVSSISERLDFDQLAAEADNVIAATVIYLARLGPGFELDLAVPRYNERTNLRSSLGMLSERLRRWQGCTAAPEKANPLSAVQREALSRAKFLPLFRARAAASGDVGEFLHVAEQLISSVTRYLNDPQLRMALDRGAPDGVTSAIIASAFGSTSDTINSCLPFQDLERVPL